jgi:hypothetical protein
MLNKLVKPLFKEMKPICTNCKYSVIRSGNSERQVCKLFANLFNIEYLDTILCRSNTILCGPEAMYFQKP